jgi:uncharacterized protein (TIGR02001 family)
MKTAFKAGVFAALALTTIAPAAQAGDAKEWGPFTAGVTLTSDYRFRGISQSDRNAAIQGWVQYDHESGFFGNIWASNIDFSPAGDTDASVEIDLTAGYNYKFSDTTNGTVKVVYYLYPDANDAPDNPNYLEVIAGVSHDFGKAAVTGEFAWSPDYYGGNDDAEALTGGVSVPLMDSFAFFDGGLSASGHVGYQWFNNAQDYLFYDVGATASWGIFDVDVRWVGTDLSKPDCGFNDICEDGVVLSLTANLPGGGD